MFTQALVLGRSPQQLKQSKSLLSAVAVMVAQLLELPLHQDFQLLQLVVVQGVEGVAVCQ
jgi:hypothetical protein